MPQGGGIQPQQLALVGGDLLPADEIVRAEVAQHVVPVPQRPDDARRLPDRPLLEIVYDGILNDGHYCLLADDLVGQAVAGDVHPAAALVPEIAVLIDAEGAGQHAGLIRGEPQSQAVEAQLASAQLHGVAAQVVQRVGHRQLNGHFVQGGKLRAEAASGLLATAQFLFGPDALSDVPGDPLDGDQLAFFLHARGGQFQADPVTVPVEHVKVERLRERIATDPPGHSPEDLHQVLRRDQIPHVHGEQYFHRVAGDPFAGLVQEGVIALRVDLENDVPGVVNDVLEPLLRPPQGLHGCLALGDVREDAENAHHLPRGVTQRHLAGEHGPGRPVRRTQGLLPAEYGLLGLYNLPIVPGVLRRVFGPASQIGVRLADNVLGRVKPGGLGEVVVAAEVNRVPVLPEDAVGDMPQDVVQQLPLFCELFMCSPLLRDVPNKGNHCRDLARCIFHGRKQRLLPHRSARSVSRTLESHRRAGPEDTLNRRNPFFGVWGREQVPQ